MKKFSNILSRLSISVKFESSVSGSEVTVDFESLLCVVLSPAVQTSLVTVSVKGCYNKV